MRQRKSHPPFVVKIEASSSTELSVALKEEIIAIRSLLLIMAFRGYSLMPRVSSKKFFAEQSAHSRVKADIVFKYVTAWATVILNPRFNQKREAAYIDLFSGPGSYEDGARSTPLLIVEEVLKKQLLREGLKTYFNDLSSAHTESLRQEIGSLSGIHNLRWTPVYTSAPASISLIDSFKLASEVPQFFFLDQFGWADVSPAIIKRIFLNRKCECAFFFRTPRVIAAVTNPNSESTMQTLFGTARLNSMRASFASATCEREAIVLNELKETMREAGATHFQPFPFRLREDNSPKQHLIYLGQHEKGLAIMKDIMGATSSAHHSGVPLMGFSEAPTQHLLFEPDPIPILQADLLSAFAGRAVSVAEVFAEHHPTNERFLLRNYQEALRRLELSSAVSAIPPAQDRPKRTGTVTMGEMVKIIFPSGKVAQ
jgi:three-Cys-motif partner protein